MARQQQVIRLDSWRGMGGDSGELNSGEALTARNVRMLPRSKLLRAPREATVVSSSVDTAPKYCVSGSGIRLGSTGHGVALRMLAPDSAWDLSGSSIISASQARNRDGEETNGCVRGLGLHQHRGGKSHTDVLPGDASGAQGYVAWSQGVIGSAYWLIYDDALTAPPAVSAAVPTDGIEDSAFYWTPPSLLSGGRAVAAWWDADAANNLMKLRVWADYVDDNADITDTTVFTDTDEEWMVGLATNHYDQVFVYALGATSGVNRAFRLNVNSEASDLDLLEYTSADDGSGGMSIPANDVITSACADRDGNWIVSTWNGRLHKLSRNGNYAMWDVDGDLGGVDVSSDLPHPKVVGVDARGRLIAYDATDAICVYDISGRRVGKFAIGVSNTAEVGAGSGTIVQQQVQKDFENAETWTVTFTSTTAFSVTGSVSGVQVASGSTDAPYSTDSGELTLPAAFWTTKTWTIGNFITIVTFAVGETNHYAYTIDSNQRNVHAPLDGDISNITSATLAEDGSLWVVANDGEFLIGFDLTANDPVMAGPSNASFAIETQTVVVNTMTTLATETIEIDTSLATGSYLVTVSGISPDTFTVLGGPGLDVDQGDGEAHSSTPYTSADGGLTMTWGSSEPATWDIGNKFLITVVDTYQTVLSNGISYSATGATGHAFKDIQYGSGHLYASMTHASSNYEIARVDLLGDYIDSRDTTVGDNPAFFQFGYDATGFKHDWPQSGELRLASSGDDRMRSVQAPGGGSIITYGDNTPYVWLPDEVGPMPAGLLPPRQALRLEPTAIEAKSATVLRICEIDTITTDSAAGTLPKSDDTVCGDYNEEVWTLTVTAYDEDEGSGDLVSYDVVGSVSGYQGSGDGGDLDGADGFIADNGQLEIGQPDDFGGTWVVGETITITTGPTETDQAIDIDKISLNDSAPTTAYTYTLAMSNNEEASGFGIACSDGVSSSAGTAGTLFEWEDHIDLAEDALSGTWAVDDKVVIQMRYPMSEEGQDGETTWSSAPTTDVELRYAWIRESEPVVSWMSPTLEVDMSVQRTKAIRVALEESPRDAGVTHWALIASYTGQMPMLVAKYPVSQTHADFSLSVASVAASAYFYTRLYRAIPPSASRVSLFQANEQVPVALYYGQKDYATPGYTTVQSTDTCTVGRMEWSDGEYHMTVTADGDTNPWDRRQMWKTFSLDAYPELSGSVIDIDESTTATKLVLEIDIPATLRSEVNGATGLRYKILGHRDRFWHSFVTDEGVSYLTTVPLDNEVQMDFATHDEILAIECMGSYVYVLGRHHVFVGYWSGTGFEFERVETTLGAISEDAVWRMNNAVGFWSERGPAMIAGREIRFLGDEMNAREAVMGAWEYDSLTDCSMAYLPKHDVLMSSDLYWPNDPNDVVYSEASDPAHSNAGKGVWTRAALYLDGRTRAICHHSDSSFTITPTVTSSSGTFDESDVTLAGDAASAGLTYTYQITFTSATDFYCYGGTTAPYETFIGSGNTGAAWEADDRQLSIAAAAWGGTFAADERVSLLVARDNFVLTSLLPVSSTDGQSRLLFGTLNGYYGETLVDDVYVNSLPLTLDGTTSIADTYQASLFVMANTDFGAPHQEKSVAAVGLEYSSGADSFDAQLYYYLTSNAATRRAMNLFSGDATPKTVWFTERNQVAHRPVRLERNRERFYAFGLAMATAPSSAQALKRYVEFYGLLAHIASR